MNIQLTISMLVSDRMETLGKSLASISPLLGELDSELIIVYTGKSPDTLRLAEQYTSHIIPFAWCDDFSRARNAGLKEARGEWFLYLDDDEWFEDVEDILRFFKSGEYKDYQSALYVQRNYNDWDGASYVDANVGRMCRITPGTKFVYPIHENLYPFAEPYKQLKSYVHHFGYIRDTGNLSADPKFQRNLSLLLKSYKEKPTSQICAQLAQEYKSVSDYAAAVRYCREGLKLAEKEQRIHTYELWLQIQLVNLLILTGDRGAALREGERLIGKPRTLEVGRAHLAGILSGLCWESGECRKGLKYARRYHKEMENLRRHPEAAERQNGITVTYGSALERAAAACTAGLLCASKLGETSAIGELLAWMPWEKEEEVRPQYGNLEKWKAAFPEQEGAILGAYYRLRTGNPYVAFQKALYMESRNMPEEAGKYFRACAADCPEGLACRLIQAAAGNGFSLSPFLGQVTAEMWDGYVEALAEQTEVSEMPAFSRKLEDAMEDYPLYAGRLNQRFLEAQLMEEGQEGARYLALAKEYCGSVGREMSALYRGDILSSPDFYALPCRHRSASWLGAAIEAFESGRFGECIPCLEKAARLNPQMAPAVGHISAYLEERLNQPEAPADGEFEALGAQVKQALGVLIKSGQWEEAYGVLEQLAALLPEDAELLRMKQEILEHRM